MYYVDVYLSSPCTDHYNIFGNPLFGFITIFIIIFHYFVLSLQENPSMLLFYCQNYIIYKHTIMFQYQLTAFFQLTIINKINKMTNISSPQVNKHQNIKNPIKKEFIMIDSDSEGQILGKPGKMVKMDTNKITNFSPYQNIQEIPQIKLTVQQMKNEPIQLLIDIQRSYEEFGAVKLVASQAWNCFFSFGNIDRPLTVRVQTIQELKQGKPFQQKVKSLRANQYKQNALYFSKNYKFKTSPSGKNNEGRREHQYWNLVTKKQYEDDKVTVQYAADLPVSLYGSGFPTRKIYNWQDSDFDYQNNLFNLNNLFKSSYSMLRISDKNKQKISGISAPWMYVGMLFSTFCWHLEDLYINSFNYSHLGETKTWYIVPKKFKQEFQKYVKNKYETCPRKKHLLEKMTLMVDPLELIAAGIKVYKVHQRPRDYVFTFAKAYHCGFSHGYNIGEAVNFISYESVVYIKQALRYYQQQQKTQKTKTKAYVIPYDWLIYENAVQNLVVPVQYRDQLYKEYRRVINREYLFIKHVIDKYGIISQVKIIQAHKKYQSNMCTHCKNYIYLSSMECMICFKNLCERHLHHCQCPIKKWKLIIRELNEDRKNITNIVPILLLCQQKQIQ